MTAKPRVYALAPATAKHMTSAIPCDAMRASLPSLVPPIPIPSPQPTAAAISTHHPIRSYTVPPAQRPLGFAVKLLRSPAVSTSLSYSRPNHPLDRRVSSRGRPECPPLERGARLSHEQKGRGCTTENQRTAVSGAESAKSRYAHL